MKTLLPALAAHDHDFALVLKKRVIANHVDITVVGVLIKDKVRMILAWQEFQIVLHEIAFVDEIFLHDLFQYVFLGCHV